MATETEGEQDINSAIFTFIIISAQADYLVLSKAMARYRSSLVHLYDREVKVWDSHLKTEIPLLPCCHLAVISVSS